MRHDRDDLEVPRHLIPWFNLGIALGFGAGKMQIACRKCPELVTVNPRDEQESRDGLERMLAHLKKHPVSPVSDQFGMLPGPTEVEVVREGVYRPIYAPTEPAA